MPPEESNRKAGSAALLAGGFEVPELEVQPSLEIQARGSQKALANPALQRFFAFQSDEWEVRWDTRGDRPNLIQGVGIPLLPGRGNKLALADLKLATRRPRRGGRRGQAARLPGRLPRAAERRGLRPAARRRRAPSTSARTSSSGRSSSSSSTAACRSRAPRSTSGSTTATSSSSAPSRWPRCGPSAKPRIDRAAALAAVVQALGFRVDERQRDPRSGDAEVRPGPDRGRAAGREVRGRARHAATATSWSGRSTFRRAGDPVTWQAQVDAKSGKILSIVDANDYVTAQVSGGIYPVTNSDPEVVRGLPFANVTNGAAKVTDAAGNYDYSGGTATVTLNGKYIKMTDTCGAISLADSATGNVAFGTSGGTDCTTPGSGGAGNTHAVAHRLLPPDQHQPQGGELPAGQRLAQRHAHRQHERQQHLQRLLGRLDGELLPFRRRLLQHG